MVVVDEFFGITSVIIIRGGSATRGVIRKVIIRGVITRGGGTRAMQQSSRRRGRGGGFTVTRGRQRGTATSTYMEGNEVMFNSFQL